MSEEDIGRKKKKKLQLKINASLIASSYLAIASYTHHAVIEQAITIAVYITIGIYLYR